MLDAGDPPLAGLVLCGGASRRMGADKALLEVDGEPLVARVARRLAEVADPVLLAPGADHQRLAGVAALAGLGMVADRPGGHRAEGSQPPSDGRRADQGAGPLGGIVAGLLASPHPLLAVVAVDMPDLSPDLLRAMSLAWPSSVHAAVPATADGLQPLHAVWSREALPQLGLALIEGRLALHEVLAGMRVEIWPEPRWGPIDPSGAFARNLNTPDDLPR